MITAAEARKQAQEEAGKLSPQVLTVIDQSVKAACKDGLMRTQVQFSLFPLEQRHVNHVLSILKTLGYGCKAGQLTSPEYNGDWLFEISW